MLARWTKSTFASLGHGDYRTLWIGSLFSTLAFMMSFTVQPVVAFEIAGTNSAVGLVQMGMGISMLLLGPFGGVIADRVSKKPLVFWGQALVGAALLATGLLIIADQMTIAILAMLTAVMGLSFSFMGPARQAWVGEMVPGPMLPNAVALSQLSMNVSRVGAPLLGAALLSAAFVGAGGTYVFMASLFVIVLAATVILPRTHAKPADQRRPVRDELLAGVRHVAGRPILRVLMLTFVAMVVLGFTFQVVLPALLSRHLDRAPSDIGLILTVNAVAALGVSVMLAGIVSSKWAFPAMLVSGVVMGLGFLALSVAPSFEVALATMLLVGPGLSGFMLVNNALIMANTAPEYFGRVMSLTMLAFGFQGALALPWGYLADSVGEREMLAIVGVAAIGVVTVATMAYLALARDGAVASVRARRTEPVAPVPAAAAEAPPARRVVPRPHGVAMMAAQKHGLAEVPAVSGD